MSAIFQDKHILITAGPTREAIDPVRYIGNRSTGKMGYAIATALLSLGAEVTLVSGPVESHLINNIKALEGKLHLMSVESAQEMYDSVAAHFAAANIAIFAAAVADYSPKEVAAQKIKKQDGPLIIELVKTKDILKEMGLRKREDQCVVGFALETDNEVPNAQKKLKEKNADIIILNSLRDAGAGFATDTNQITILDKYNNISKFELKQKEQVASDILDYISRYLHA